jgi:hypothetical protein
MMTVASSDLRTDVSNQPMLVTTPFTLPTETLSPGWNCEKKGVRRKRIDRDRQQRHEKNFSFNNDEEILKMLIFE